MFSRAKAIEAVEVERPWSGPDAVTGLTMEQFAERLAGVDAPDWAKRAAVAICRSYAIGGWSDPGYIANVIAGQAPKVGGAA